MAERKCQFGDLSPFRVNVSYNNLMLIGSHEQHRFMHDAPNAVCGGSASGLSVGTSRDHGDTFLTVVSGSFNSSEWQSFRYRTFYRRNGYR